MIKFTLGNLKKHQAMELIKKLMMAALTAVAVTACGDDGGSESTPEAATLQKSVPASGEKDVATTTGTIELTFTSEVNFVSGKEADFNGTKCGMTSFSKSGNTMTFSIPAQLKRGETYTLSVPTGFFTTKNGGAEVAAFAVTFSTPEVKAPSADGIAKELVTTSPLPAAKAVYDYLLSSFGVKTLSSAIANVNWNTDEADMVYAATGKYPAIATVDYLHFYTLYDDANRNPYKGGWKVDYEDISQLKAWWDAGGIVSACWHWNVPNKEAEKYSTDSYTCTPGSGTKNSDGTMTTTFRPKNIFVEGTWEQKIASEDLALMATLLKRFQEAGIPVIWRPLHEASGNSASGGTAWFWWGIDGAETYKQLWRKMFNYFQEQGLNNLIWVWTTQTGYGYDTKKGIVNDSEWYPGDEYVDVVGRDEYSLTLEQSIAEYEAIRSAFPNKLTTLSECGSVAKMSEQIAGGAAWSWVMPWYDYDADNTAKSLDKHQHANTQWWKDAMSNENVVTRDQLPSFK